MIDYCSGAHTEIFAGGRGVGLNIKSCSGDSFFTSAQPPYKAEKKWC